MIYVTSTQSLFSSTGEFIKHIRCPLATRLSRELGEADAEREFQCGHCNSTVRNLRFLSDAQALQAVKADPDVCFFAAVQAENVIHVTEPRQVHWLVCDEWDRKKSENQEVDWPVIRTARSREEINFALANGFDLLFRQVQPSKERDHLGAYLDKDTNRVSFVKDVRLLPTSKQEFGSEKVTVVDYFSYTPTTYAPPIAAYVIPAGLAIGTEVFVQDVIEHLLMDMPQGNSTRLGSWWAIWTGEDLSFLPQEPLGFVG